MKTSIKVVSGIIIAALFLWLAMREIEFDKVWEVSGEMTFLWLIPFVLAVLTSHFSRAMRWRMLVRTEQVRPPKTTMFTGIMFGYLANILFARLGEVTRPVYVARQLGDSNSRIIGTVVLERIIDTLSLLLIMSLVFFFLISDHDVLQNLFGADLSNSDILWGFAKKATLYAGIAASVVLLLYITVKTLSNKIEFVHKFSLKVRGVLRTFIDGIMAVKELKNWPLFLFYTAAIWICYTLMVYIPFWMFNMQSVFGLTMTDALVLTMVSAVGIIIPAPGGIGTYHLFITKSLYLLYAVPETFGFAYATITHAATMVIIIITAPVLLAADKFVTMKSRAKLHADS